jgi:predicted enzyme related to lactoylglutathione lyase
MAVADNQGQIVQPKQEIPGVGWLAYCQDTESNIFGVLQPVPMPM